MDGIPIENERAILYSEQAGYPFADSPTLNDIPRGSAALIYVDVWERHVTYVEDDHLREVALEGPDTCTRSQVVWQVKVLIQGTRLDKGKTALRCDAADMLPHLGTGKLRARAYLDKPVTELCAIPPSSRYRGAENQLYRVEVHQGGETAAAASYKWSRENGSVTFPIRRLSGNTATLETLGRDYDLSLKVNDWVEVMDDSHAQSGTPGLLARVEHVYRDDLKVTISQPGPTPPPLPSYSPADSWRHPLLRRWDHVGDPDAEGALPIIEGTDPGNSAEGWQELEYGVQIRFSPGGQYMSGDYWLIPARVATGDVEWPHEVNDHGVPLKDADGNPIALGRHAAGVYHSYASLRLVRAISAGNLSGHDCRNKFAPLPYVTYESAYGAGAIGSHLVTTAARSRRASRGSPT